MSIIPAGRSVSLLSPRRPLGFTIVPPCFFLLLLFAFLSFFFSFSFLFHTTITHRPTGLPPSTHQSRTSLPFRPTPHPISHPIIIMSGGGHGTQCLLVIFCHNEVASLKLRQVWGGLAKGFPPPDPAQVAGNPFCAEVRDPCRRRRRRYLLLLIARAASRSGPQRPGQPLASPGVRRTCGALSRWLVRRNARSDWNHNNNTNNTDNNEHDNDKDDNDICNSPHQRCRAC